MAKCPDCLSEDVVRKGTRHGKQRFKCNECGLWFSDEVKQKELSNEVSGDDKKMGVFDWREWSDLLTKRQALHEKASFSQDAATISIDTKYPCIVWKPMADMHIGDMGVDYESLRDFTDKVLSTPWLYLSLSGDEEDNFISFKNQLAILQQILSPEEQDAFLESWLSELSPRILFSGYGNHAEFEERVSARNTVKRILSRNVIYFNGIGVCNVKINEQQYKIVTTHKTRYNSSFNKTHGLKQLARRDVPDADVYISAHIHDPAYEVSFERGLEQSFIVLGSIKRNDGFGKRYFSYFAARRDAAVVLDSSSHRCIVFPCLDDALDYARLKNTEANI